MHTGVATPITEMGRLGVEQDMSGYVTTFSMSVRTTTSTQEGFRLLVSIYFSRADRAASVVQVVVRKRMEVLFQVMISTYRFSEIRITQGRERERSAERTEPRISVEARFCVNIFSESEFSTTEVVPRTTIFYTAFDGILPFINRSGTFATFE